MNGRKQCIGLAAGFAILAASGAAAQYTASGFGVYDAHGALVGQVVDLGTNPTDLSFDRATIAASFAGHSLVGYAETDVVSFAQSGLVVFDSPGCTGQAWIFASPNQVTPRFIEPQSVVGTDRRLYVGSRTDVPQSIPNFSFLGEGQPCFDANTSATNMVKATFVGTLPAFDAPFHVGPTAVSLGGGGGAPVAAVTPAALAFLAALLLLTGIAFVGKRAGRR
jgi:hypothetical protein